jgi:hypothetical protein
MARLFAWMTEILSPGRIGGIYYQENIQLHFYALYSSLNGIHAEIFEL